MSGAEVVSLISAIISIIDASLQLYEAVNNASGLPKSFRDVAVRLPLVQDTLETARTGLTREEDEPSTRSRVALTKVLESCRDKVVAANAMLQAVMPATGASRMKRYYKAFKTIPKGDKVESLMEGILGDLQVLTSSYAVKAATQARIERLIVAVRGGERLNVVDDGGGTSPAVDLHNLGLGSQYVHTGHGNQNVADGRGIQINGASTGPFYFNQTK